MKILIKGTANKEDARKTPANVGYTKSHMDFRRMMLAIQGTWVEVDTKYCFEDQFNTVPIEGVSSNGMRIQIESVADIDFENLGEEGFKKKVTDYYANAWPGLEPKFYHIDRLLFKAGKREKDPAKEIEEKRGYDIWGKPIK